ncbi:hypothetical protein NP233_g9649 [Leucocoprinus birnbaumii]|uniref:Uncharacterized protein n=1 Tax=Leucocoprinus birnbaumii TaxID=56174 RepID=A0AAD5VNI8_9AGAR|nr:hypothetical protein NP233_g9649 [Leucocoprinus birnbaumii]
MPMRQPKWLLVTLKKLSLRRSEGDRRKARSYAIPLSLAYPTMAKPPPALQIYIKRISVTSVGGIQIGSGRLSSDFPLPIYADGPFSRSTASMDHSTQSMINLYEYNRSGHSSPKSSHFVIRNYLHLSLIPLTESQSSLNSMNPNVTYTSYGHPTSHHHHSQVHSQYTIQTPHTSNPPSGIYRINPSINNRESTSIGTMDNASLTHYNTNMNNGVGGVGSDGRGVPRRQDTRNSYLSYASTNTPSWVNPSTMMETQVQSTPLMHRGGGRPLPDPANYTQNGRMMNQQQQYQQQANGYDYSQGGYGGYHAQGHGHAERPSSGGFVITNTVVEEEEYVHDMEDEGNEELEEEEHHRRVDERRDFPQQSAYGYAGGLSPHNMYSSMPVGMGVKGVPMERVAPPSASPMNANSRGKRPLPIPGASQPLGGASAFNVSKKKSFVGGFLVGLRRLPKRVLRYGSKKEKRRFGGFEEPELDEELGMFGGNESQELPRYNSNPVTPTAGPSNNRSRTPIRMTAEETSGMPGSMPMSPPALHTQTTEMKQPRRTRKPSFTLTPPPGETLRPEHLSRPEDQEFFDPPPESEAEVPNGVVDYPPPSTERERATVMMYHEEPPQAPATQETHGTMATGAGATGTVTPNSDRPATVRNNTSTSVSRMASNHTSGNIASERARAGTPAPAPPINTAVSPPQIFQSPETAHPPPANDYMKMTLSPRPQTHATEVTEHTTFQTSRSFTNDPSFSSELNPVFRFFYSFYRLPWISDRSTVDYSPLIGFGGKSGGRGIISKKAGQSWYRKKGDANIGAITSGSLDLLAAEGDTSITRRVVVTVTITAIGDIRVLDIEAMDRDRIVDMVTECQGGDGTDGAQRQRSRSKSTSIKGTQVQ